MRSKSALVTGGCGFVGRHFVRWLLDNDYHVTAVDNLSSGIAPGCWPKHLRVQPSEQRQFNFVETDFRQFAIQAEPRFDLVVHLAAVVGGRLTIEGDPLAVATDLAIDATLFNWVTKRVRPRQVLYFSSSAAYPISDQTSENHRPLSEETIRFAETIGVPDMTYGWSKLTGEFLAMFAAENYGLNVVSYRPFSGYGEDQDFTYPFPSIMRRIVRKESPLVVWGSGKQQRDFIHIDDVVDAVFASCGRMNPGEVLNLCSGEGTTFRSLANLGCHKIGHEVEVVNDSTKPEGVFARVGNPTRMFSYYEPRISLEQGVERVLDYQLRAALAA